MHIILSKDFETKTYRHVITGKTINSRVHKDVHTGDDYDVYEDKDGNTVISKQLKYAVGTIDPETRLFVPKSKD